MNVVFSVAFIAGAFYMIWWGYRHLLRRERDAELNVVQGALCHICHVALPMDELVIREKKAGFENYFCGSCIAELAHDYNEKVRNGTAPVILTVHTLDGDDRMLTTLN